MMYMGLENAREFFASWEYIRVWLLVKSEFR